MKFTVELTIQQVKGITDYLKDGDESVNPSISDVRNYLSNIVHSTLESPQEAVSDYIKKQTAN